MVSMNPEQTCKVLIGRHNSSTEPKNYNPRYREERNT